MVMTILSWMLFGLIVGAIARLLYPGRQNIGLLATMILGIVGSLLGGFIAYAAGFAPMEEGPLRGSGWIMSIIGALIVVWTTLFISSRSNSPRVTGRGAV